jgi:HSP20 family protein
MSRIPKDILKRLSYFHREAEGLFRRLFEEELGPTALGEDEPYPLVDVVEAEDEILIRADLPGTGKEAIELYGAPNFVVIKGNKRATRETWTYLRVERSFGPFQRLVVLPIPGDPSRISARYDAGVLEVRVPKVVDRRKIHRQIPID